MGPLIVEVLRAGAPAVLDFAGNRVEERAWVRGLAEVAGGGSCFVPLMWMKKSACGG